MNETIAKRAFNINIKRLLKKAVCNFGDTDNIFILEREAHLANSATRGKVIYPRMYNAVSRAVYSVCLLLDGGTSSLELNCEPFVRAINDAQRKKAFSYNELCMLREYSAIYALVLISQNKHDLRLFDDLITVLRFICDIDFEEFLAFVSPAEKTLRESESFLQSDTETRKLCRNNVISCAKHNGISEKEAAKKLALENKLFEISSKASKYYFPALYIMTAVFTVLSIFVMRSALPILLLLPFSELAKYICDQIFSRYAKTTPVPKLKIDNVPDNAKTIVVFAALLTGGKEDKEIFERLRQAYYSNKGANVRFGILADLKDSDEEESTNDREIIEKAKKEIDELRELDSDAFFLFTRKRIFSKSEDKYIGWERKRGAVLSLVRAIKGSKNVACSDSISQELFVYGADSAFLRDVRYVVTLDSDTRLYHGAIVDMVRTMLHPANRPTISGKAVVKGYGIMQPRMDPALDSASRTPFSMLLCGGGGTDIYSLASYETYQSLFCEGIFCGKGIFDVDAFYHVLNDAFPDETVLSHDLLEGSRLRTAAITDISLTDSIPKNPLSFFKRNHRWIRGDIQALKFAGGYVKDRNGNKIKNPISKLSRYKLFDNLRRELFVIFSFATIVLPPLFGCSRLISVSLALLALTPIFVPFIFSLFKLIRSAGRKFYSGVMPGLFNSFFNMIFSVAALPYNAFVTADAIVRAWFRSNVSHKHMLQWVTASEADSKRYGILLYIRKMLFSILSGFVILIISSGAIYRMLGIMWVLFPLVAYLSGKTFRSHEVRASRSEKAILTKYALDMWRFFEEKVTAADNWLPPDNYQLSPVEAVAHRTSPTNIGLYLLSCLAACDFGFIDKEDMYMRVSCTIETIKKLAKWRGHLYNWYDTQNLGILGTPYVSTVDSGNFITCLIALRQGLLEYSEKDERFKHLADSTLPFVKADLAPLYNKKKELFAIGIDTVSQKMSDSYYDIFMSEARTTSYYAIANGTVPRKHWSRLSRVVTGKDGHIGLMSWTGTMFEFFMPSLLLPVKRGSLSYEALRFCLRMQRKNCAKGIWGRSESGYFMFDPAMNYQYKAFGVPFLGLKAGLEKDLVISPYSSFLALKAAIALPLSNLSSMKEFGMYGKYGFFEAIDLTRSRVGKGHAIIRSYMSHHVGMSIIASANACFDDVFVKRFMSDPVMRSASELLDEKIPVDIKLKRHIRKQPQQIRHVQSRNMISAYGGRYPSSTPEASIISSGVMRLVACGGDVSIYSDDKALNVDPFVFGSIHGMKLVFSADKKVYSAIDSRAFCGRLENTICYKFSEDHIKAETRIALHGNYRCLCISFFAEGDFSRICPMLYFEPSMAKTKDRQAHPAYSDLSIEAEYLCEYGILLFRRKRRREDEKEGYLAVTLESHSENISFAVRRDDVLPLMYTEKDIEALLQKSFPCSDGACIDPLCAVKKPSVSENGKYKCDFLVASGSGRDEVISVINSVRQELKQGRRLAAYRIFSRSIDQILDERLCCCGGEETSRFVSILLYCLCGKGKSDSSLKRKASINELWSLGISGDYPIICLDITADEIIRGGFASRLISGFIYAHKYLNFSGICSDLVIVCHDNGDYMGSKMSKVKELVAFCGSDYLLFRKGGIFIADELACFDLISSIACLTATIDGEETLDTISAKHLAPSCEKPEIISSVSDSYDTVSISRKIYKVKGGAFTEDGFEIYKKETTAPWSYIYSGRQFGTLLTQNSLGYTFISNSHEKRITPFNCDNLLDFSGERLIMSVRGRSYDLCACSSNVTFTNKCAIYEGMCDRISYIVKVGVDIKLPVKLVYVTLSEPARVSYEIQPVMGDTLKYPQLIESTKDENGVVRFKNLLSSTLSDFVGFKIALKSKGVAHGENGLSGAPFAPDTTDHRCKTMVDAEYGDALHDSDSSIEYCFILGACNEKGSTIDFVQKKLIKPSDALKSFDEYASFYDSMLNHMQLSSKHPELDIMIDRYLPYQTLVCRMFARTGFYQSSGAYGFRDQLQDCLAAMRFCPDIVKTHILRCASHQYPEGDVMHWWHYIDGRSVGVRTLCSDDYLWLPYVCAEYVNYTGDKDILDIKVPYIDSPPLAHGERERFETPEKSRIKESLYMHCIRAIEHSMRFGAHGLPYMGSCDWNDGMSAIGDNGGESVWLGFFLVMVIDSFLPICQMRNDDSAIKYKETAESLRSALSSCFKGDRYLRAFYGDGTPVGAPENKECSIDIIPQAFAALSLDESELCKDTDESKRAKLALDTAYKMLFDKENSILKLFTPPFNGSGRYPGYISGYVEGVRENGGQYTHAAVWGAMAMLKAGMTAKGCDVLLSINSASASKNERYRTEPYFLCGDVYSNPAFPGRGGWSLYTGAAGWFYNAVIEYLLCYHEEENGFTITPCLCDQFDSYTLRISKHNTEYFIVVRAGDSYSCLLDCKPIGDADNKFFRFDKNSHIVEITVEKS